MSDQSMQYMFDDLDIGADELDKAVIRETIESDNLNSESDDNNDGTSSANTASKEELEDFFRTGGIMEQDDDDEPVEGSDQSAEEDDNDNDEDSESSEENTETDDESEEEGSDSEEEDGEDDEESEVDEDSLDFWDIIKEEGLLYVPEDFEGELDAETLDELKRNTFLMRDMEILQSRRNMFANDPEKLAYFDYLMTGGVDADLPKFRSITENIRDYESFDVSNEETQRQILTEYLKDGLDPENPAHQFRLSKLSQEVDEIMDKYEGEAKAEEAKSYFVQKYKSLADQEQQRVESLQRKREQMEMLQQQEEYKWHQNFQETLSERKWSEQKKRSILEEQYTEVQMQDGSYQPLWYVKEQMIKSDPQLYQIYLDWLNTSFDINSGTFKNEGPASTQKEVTRKIMSIINKKDKGRKTGSPSKIKNKGKNKNREVVVDPRDAL